MKRSMRLVVLMLAGAFALAACSADGGSGVASLTETTTTTAAASNASTTEAAVLAFAQCMRDAGIEDFEDPIILEDGSIEFPSKAGEKTKGLFEEVFAVCEPKLAGTSFSIGKSDGEAAAAVDQLLAFSECMRAEGFDMPDPAPDGSFPDFDKESDEFTAAWEACEAVFGAGGK